MESKRGSKKASAGEGSAESAGAAPASGAAATATDSGKPAKSKLGKPGNTKSVAGGAGGAGGKIVRKHRAPRDTIRAKLEKIHDSTPQFKKHKFNIRPKLALRDVLNQLFDDISYTVALNNRTRGSRITASWAHVKGAIRCRLGNCTEADRMIQAGEAAIKRHKAAASASVSQ